MITSSIKTCYYIVYAAIEYAIVQSTLPSLSLLVLCILFFLSFFFLHQLRFVIVLLGRDFRWGVELIPLGILRTKQCQIECGI